MCVGQGFGLAIGIRRKHACVRARPNENAGHEANLKVRPTCYGTIARDLFYIYQMFKIITIPFNNNTETFSDEILTNFTINKRVKHQSIEFFLAEGKPYWTVFLEYDTILEDNTESEISGLSDAEKMLFDRLKQWRREKANDEGVPVYIIATNREIKDVIKASPKNVEEVSAIKGFGRKRTGNPYQFRRNEISEENMANTYTQIHIHGIFTVQNRYCIIDNTTIYF